MTSVAGSDSPYNETCLIIQSAIKATEAAKKLTQAETHLNFFFINDICTAGVWQTETNLIV